MSRDVYHEMFMHFIWHIKAGLTPMSEEMQQDVYKTVRRRALEPGGLYVHEIGGTENHVHMVVRVRPTLLISEWIGRVKGGSAHDINEMDRWRKRLQWQTGYGIVCFGESNLVWVKRYVQSQKEHHANGTAVDRLERTDSPDGDGSSQE